MTPEERAQVLEELSIVLIEDFQRNFHEVLAEAFTATAYTPEQANNEIRNALLHCARVCGATTVDEAKVDLAQARWHISLAVRDCFLICLRQRREDIVRILDFAEYRHGAFKHADRQRLRKIDSKVRQLVKKGIDPATRQDPGLTKEFEAAYADILDFFRHVVETNPPRPWLGFRWRIRFWKIANKIGSGLVVLAVAAILSSSIMPAWMKAYYDQAAKHVFCKIASDPSCN